jgi:hypothetical protein
MSKNITEVIEETPKQDEYMDHWTPAEKEICKSRYGCEILVENGSYAEVRTKESPSDARIVKYEVDGQICYDLTRGNKMANIFDMYWDKFREGLKSIDFGYGRVNPRLWGYQSPKTKKRK